MRPHDFLYLSRADVEQIALPMETVISAVTEALVEKAEGRADLPPKHWIAPSERRFFSAMSSALPAWRAAACKWQSGSPDNHLAGRPYITGQLILNDMDSGMPLAIMDSTWITEKRTAAATAVAAGALAQPGPAVLGVLGCGVQARSNLEALRLIFPSLKRVQAYDIDAGALERYASEMSARHGAEVLPCSGPREAFAGADIVLTCGPITPCSGRVAGAEWLEAGSTAVTLDYDCYWQPDALAKVDRLFCDDVRQLEQTKLYGYFSGVPANVREVAEVVANRRSGRTSSRERVVVVNMGIALEDVATAVRVFEAARARGLGTRLPI
jgi:ornithine cyclodeaminase/alanine dehydrogenase